MSNGGISGISVIDWRIFFHSKGMGICTRSDTGHTSDPQSMVVVITQTSSDSQCMGLACETVLKWVDGSFFCWIIIFIQGAVKYIMILLLPLFCCSFLFLMSVVESRFRKKVKTINTIWLSYIFFTFNSSIYQKIFRAWYI